MKNPYVIWIIIIAVYCVNPKVGYGQNCIQTAEIEGTICGGCTPEGWETTSSSPDIVDPSGTLCGIGESPGGGGNAMHLFSNGSTDIEGVITEITIDDFTPGVEYYFSMYFAQCGDASSDIELTIDGEEFTIGPSEDWELFEICITPTSSTFDLFITVAPYPGGVVSNTLLDDGECTPDFCCQLFSVVEEEEAEICPDEMYTIVSEYFNEIGDVEVIWTSEPSSGVSFLDNPNDINPIFYMPPQTEFEGETYIFTLSVEDSDCIVFETFELTVGPAIVPEFEIYLCEIYEDQDLPPVSFDPFSGTWTGNFNFDELGGTIQEYTFTIDEGQENCLENWTYQYPIDTEVISTFEIETTYCIENDNTIRLPDESEEEIEGEWSPRAKFTPSELGVGTFIYTFQPDIEFFCSQPFDLEITIISGQQPIFELPTEYCASNDTLFLPTLSHDSIQGFWNPEYIDLNTIGSFVSKFTANDAFNCYEDVSLTIDVLSSIENIFSIPDTICKHANTVIELDSISQQGNSGTWIPAAFNLDTINENSLSSTWNPDSLGCGEPIIQTITILSPQIAEFNLPDTLCRSHGIFNLPLVSENSISGSWSTPSFNTLDINGSSFTANFIPSIQHCALTQNITIEIIDDIIPEFSITNAICPGDQIFILPNISNDGIEGEWTISEIDPSIIVDSITSIFQSNQSDNCVKDFALTFYVSDNIIPSFTLPTIVCEDSSILEFSNVSDNNIQGTWQLESFNPLSFDDLVFTNIFTPTDIECYSTLEVDITILNFNNIDTKVIEPTTCESLDGQFTILNTNSDMMFSIDEGVTWQEEPLFENLPSGNYSLQISYNDLLASCTQEIDVVIKSPESARIDSISVGEIKNCTDQFGMATIIARGNNLEFSLDNGNTWQVDPIFNNLLPDLYTLIARADNSNACADTIAFEILSFTETMIENIAQVNPSDCGFEDGIIEIFSTGNDLEYSIDNGLTWQTDNIFSGLPPAAYIIIARSKLSLDCLADTTVTLLQPELPSILNVLVNDVDNCTTKNGKIEILTSSQNVEFSIDNGLTWSQDATFLNLNEGTYNVVLRNINNPSCLDATTVEVGAPTDITIEDIEVVQPSDCISHDGSIKIITSNSNYQFSIDTGLTWQDDNRFNLLIPSAYQIMIRDKLATDCIESFFIDIIQPLCPCLIPNVEFVASPVFCEAVNSGSIEILDINGFYTNEDYIFSWQNGSTDFNLTDLTEGWHTYTIEYDKNCQYKDSIYVDSLDPLAFGLITYDQDCKDLGQIEVVDFEGGAGSYSFSIDNLNFQPTNLFSNLTAQEYSIWIEDILDCQANEDAKINANFQLELELPQINPIQSGDIVNLNPLINETSIDSFVWSPSEGILNEGELIAQVSPQETTEYHLTIYFGECVETRSVKLEVLPNLNIYVANVFSPNNDNDNDLFIIQGPPHSNIIIESFNIYDRWGNLVYESNNFRINESAVGWDGYYNNEKANLGVYVYYIKYSVENKNDILVGTLHLVR